MYRETNSRKRGAEKKVAVTRADDVVADVIVSRASRRVGEARDGLENLISSLNFICETFFVRAASRRRARNLARMHIKVRASSPHLERRRGVSDPQILNPFGPYVSGCGPASIRFSSYRS